ncbi:MAG TPA: helix-turn-helix transcriptional regulator [Roseiflexaceae bacterium]|nr:helix-turn-helix transcriptional regulator [Roseiflexaceae bacterium]
METFGPKLSALRQREGLTMRELAEALGYQSHGHLGLIEQNKRNPTLEIVLRVANYFGVRVDLLLRNDVSVEDVLAAPLNRSGAD